jgi:cytidyltransferase-like protein
MLLRVGSKVKAPCGHKGVVIWISEDGRYAGVRCLEAKKHMRVKEAWGVKQKTYVKPVYIVEPDEFNANKTIVFTGGFFHILHRGHISLFREAKSLGDYLIVCVHRNECIERKRGVCAVPLEDRKAVLESIKYIDEVWVCSENCDLTQVAELHKLRRKYPKHKLIYAKGGEYTPENLPYAEKEACKKLGIEIRFGVGGGKVQSSSWLIEKLLAESKRMGC